MFSNTLFGAIKDNDIEIIQLVSKREGFNIENKIGEIEYTALQVACLYGSFKTIKFLIEELNADINIKNGNGQNLLHIICSRENLHNENLLDVIDYFIDLNILPEEVDNNGNTCLNTLCINHDLNDVSKYIQHFIENHYCAVFIENKDGNDAIDVLEKTHYAPNINNVKCMIKYSGISETLLMSYSSFLDTDFVDELYEYGEINIMELYVQNLNEKYINMDILRHIAEKDDNFPDFVKKNISELRKKFSNNNLSWFESYL